MTLLERYEIQRSGTVYTVELFQHDTPHPTRRNFYAYVSDASENVVRTRDNSTDVLAKRAAENAIANWFRRSDPIDYSKRKHRQPELPVDKIVGALRADPGCGLVDVAAAIGKKTGTVNRWMEMLTRAGLVRYEMTTCGTRRKKLWFACEGAAL